MRKLLIGVGGLVSLVVLFVMAIFAASESGEEIVTLRSRAADGSLQETRLWVVDDGGYAWLRAGVPTNAWLVRIESDPAVEVERSGETAAYTAVPVREPVVRDRIHALMRAKYAFPDRFISLIRDGDLSVAVRLEPVSPTP